MNQYLLLRDNKQSGPFSPKELENMGLKPYDLVWQEGKSAAWRYPSEIDELKRFAPVVEEQPFDRFFKKPATETVQEHAEHRKYQPAVRSSSGAVSATTPPIQQNGSNASKVFVTMPASQRDGMTEQPRVQAITTPVREDDQLTQKPVQEVTYSRYISSSPADDNVPVQPFGAHRDEVPVATAPARRRMGMEKNVLRGLVAASLVLIGVLIGMFFMSRNQTMNIKQLNALVEEIQDKNERERKQLQTHNAAGLVVELPSDEENAVEKSSLFHVEADAKEEVTATPVRNTAANVVKKIPTKAEQKPAVVEDSVPVIETAATEPVMPAPKKDEAASELARKNLFQLVNLKGNDYKTGLLGGVSNLKLTVVNKSSYQLEKIEVQVDYLGPESKVVRSQQVTFENVAPGEELTIDVPKSSRGVSVNYAIKQINSRELGIAHSGM